MYAAQFMAAMKQQMDVPAIITSGDLSPIFNWLKTNIWQHGSLLSTNDLVKPAAGEALNPAHFKTHLQCALFIIFQIIEIKQGRICGLVYSNNNGNNS
jgi:Zn-dependent M32 family carboxypeptidase